MVELSYGDIQPKGSDQDKERSKFIAMLFMAGADPMQCGHLMKDFKTNHSLGLNSLAAD